MTRHIGIYAGTIAMALAIATPGFSQVWTRSRLRTPRWAKVPEQALQ